MKQCTALTGSFHVIPHWNCATHRLAHVASGLAFTTDSRHTEAGRLYKCPAEDETRTLLQRALDNAGHEYNFRKNELDYATAFASPVKVTSRSHCAYNTVQVSSTGRPWFVDNDSLGGDDEHAQPNAELAWELSGQTLAKRRTRFNVRIKKDIKLSALHRAIYAIERQFEVASAPPAHPSTRHRPCRRSRRRAPCPAPRTPCPCRCRCRCRRL